ncbi:MAG: hypothetical protein DRZ90_17370 [Spirochaetes bacterium]|nr:MAG: hypothetical protein DRZ90_17370 [Spirochaetota bacterium]
MIRNGLVCLRVSSFPFEGYITVVNVQMKRFFTVTLIVVGIFLVTVATVFILSRFSVVSGKSALSFALISGGVVAVLSLPVLIWLAVSSGNLENYSAFTVEEIGLTEDELTEAVGNWVYSRYKRRMEDEARFLEDEEGNVTCRVTVRKD